MPFRLLPSLLLALVAVLLGSTAAASAPGMPERIPVPERPGPFIVVYETDTADPLAKTRGLERRLGVRSSQRFERAVKGFAADLTPAQVEQLGADPGVAYVAPDRPRRIAASVALRAGETAPSGARRTAAASSTTTREAATSGVAVIDTGVDLDHPDLSVGPGRDCTAAGSADDLNGHGTHVAGTVGARNTGAGVVGIVPGTTIHPVKVLDAKGAGRDSQVICGLDWVAENAAALNIRVANLSLGGEGREDGACGARAFDPLHAAICRLTARGVSVVVAAGNETADLGASAPAAYQEVLTVTAMADGDGAGGARVTSTPCGEADDAVASFSNYATVAADAAHTLAAPGVCITSTAPGGRYVRMSGTSMAAPHVAGVVASCLGEAGRSGPCAGLTPAQITAKLRADAGERTLRDPAHGFAGDPSRPRDGRFYGHLAWEGSADASLSAAPVPMTPARSEPQPGRDGARARSRPGARARPGRTPADAERAAGSAGARSGDAARTGSGNAARARRRPGARHGARAPDPRHRPGAPHGAGGHRKPGPGPLGHRAAAPRRRLPPRAGGTPQRRPLPRRARRHHHPHARPAGAAQGARRDPGPQRLEPPGRRRRAHLQRRAPALRDRDRVADRRDG
jgi:subtilisin family serine protease